MKFPNVLIMWEVFADQGSSISQQLLKMHALNPLIRCWSRRECLKVSRGSLAPEKLLTILFSTSLDKGFFLRAPATFIPKLYWETFEYVSSTKVVLTLTVIDCYKFPRDDGNLALQNWFQEFCACSTLGFFTKFPLWRVYSSCDKRFTADQIHHNMASYKKRRNMLQSTWSLFKQMAKLSKRAFRSCLNYMAFEGHHSYSH